MGMWSEVREAAGFGPSRTVVAERTLQQASQIRAEAQTYVQEGVGSMMARLNMALDDRGWIKMDGLERDGQGLRLSFSAIKAAAANATALALGNPIMARAVEAQFGYVWGDEPLFSGLGRLEKAPSIRANLTDATAQWQLEFDKATTGNIFVFVGDDKTVQRIPFSEIIGLVVNPQRADEVWYYLREWNVIIEGDQVKGTQRTKTVRRLYRASSWDAPRQWDLDPVYGYDPTDDSEAAVEQLIGYQPRVIDGVPVDTSGVLYHAATKRVVGGVWGVTELLSGIFYATEHKELVEAGDSVWRAQSQYAVQIKSKTRKALESVAAEIAGPAPMDELTGKPMQYGNTLGTGDNVEMQLMQKIGAGIDFTSFEPIANLASIGTGIPVDVVLGKEEANTTLPFTTKRTMRLHQRFWQDFYRDVFDLLGKPTAKAFFPKIDPDPTFRQMQTIAGVRALGVHTPDQITELVNETLGKTDWDNKAAPADAWADRAVVTANPGSTEVSGDQGDGPITGGQGQSGKVGKLSDGDHSLRDGGQQPHTKK